LLHLKTGMFDIINILGFNSPEWLIANNGCQLAGCIAAGIYATNIPDACHYITEHSKANVVVLEDNKQLIKYRGCKIATLKHVVTYAEAPDAQLVAAFKAEGVSVYYWPDFLALGANISTEDVTARSDALKPGNCSTLIYTSGTTGPPKAVMISHDNITWTTRNLATFYPPFDHEDRIISYLPLSHIAAQVIDVHVPLRCGACTYFCQPDALKGTLTVTLKEVFPTIFFGVPRVWEKIQEKMMQLGSETTGLKKHIATWAKGLGKEKNKRAQFGAEGGTPFGFGCANAIVLKKVKDALGLTEVKACFTAAAPLSPEVIWYFSQLDIQVYEVFGQSECTGPHTCSYGYEWKVGTCGRPMYGTVSKLAEGTGELCYAGRHIFMGYMYMEEQTKETIDSEGFLHSGDVAEFDADVKSKKNGALEDFVGESGFMKITGRIKELLITAGGENIPPVLIETNIKNEMAAVSNCIVVGDKRKYLCMLVSLKCKMDPATGAPIDDLDTPALSVGKTIGSEVTTLTAAASCPKWAAYIDAGMKTANKGNASSAQHVQKWKMLPVDLSEKEGDLTPTLKLKRSVVVKKYTSILDEMYGEVLTF